MEQTVFDHGHDHDNCIADTLALVERDCEDRRLQLTAVRRRALEVLLKEHRAVGAYEVLEVLRAEGLGAQPPVAYRALKFLVDHGFAHRIERLNAFVGCVHPGERHAPSFLICRGCSTVAELPARRAVDTLRDAASDLGFTVESITIEADGLCPACTGGRQA